MNSPIDYPSIATSPALGRSPTDLALEAVTRVEVPIERAKLTDRGRRNLKVTGFVLGVVGMIFAVSQIAPPLVAAFEKKASEYNNSKRPAPPHSTPLTPTPNPGIQRWQQ